MKPFAGNSVVKSPARPHPYLAAMDVDTENKNRQPSMGGACVTTMMKQRSGGHVLDSREPLELHNEKKMGNDFNTLASAANAMQKIRTLESKLHSSQSQCGRLESDLATLQHLYTSSEQSHHVELTERDGWIQELRRKHADSAKTNEDKDQQIAELKAQVAELEQRIAETSTRTSSNSTKLPPPPLPPQRRARRASNDRPVNYDESPTGTASVPISPEFEYEEFQAQGNAERGVMQRRRSSSIKQPTLSALNTVDAEEKVFLAIPEYEGRINERYYTTGLHFLVYAAPSPSDTRRAMVCCHCGSTKSFATAELFAKSMSHLTLHLLRHCPNIPQADIDKIPGKACTRPLMDMPMYAKQVWKLNVPTWDVLGMEPNKRGGFSGMGAQMGDDVVATSKAPATKTSARPKSASRSMLPLVTKKMEISTAVESAAGMLCLLAAGETVNSSHNEIKDNHDDAEVRNVLLAQPEHKGILSPRYFSCGMHFFVFRSPGGGNRRVMKCRHCSFTASYASVDIMTLSMAHLPRHLMRTCKRIPAADKQQIEQCTPGERGTIAMKTFVEQIWKRKVPVLDTSDAQETFPSTVKDEKQVFKEDFDPIVDAAQFNKEAENAKATKPDQTEDEPVETAMSKDVVKTKPLQAVSSATHSAMGGPSELLQVCLDNMDEQVLLSLPGNEGEIRSRYYWTGLSYFVTMPRGDSARRVMVCKHCGATKSFAGVDQLHKSIAHLSLHLLRHCPNCPEEAKSQIAACPPREDARVDLPTFAKQVWKRSVPICDMPRSGTGMLTSGGGKPKTWQKPVDSARLRPKRGIKCMGNSEEAIKRQRLAHDAEQSLPDNATLLKRTNGQSNAPLKHPVGTTFTKHFPGIGSFNGKVVGHDGSFYLVEYADKDEEDLTELDLDGLVPPAGGATSKEHIHDHEGKVKPSGTKPNPTMF